MKTERMWALINTQGDIIAVKSRRRECITYARELCFLRTWNWRRIRRRGLRVVKVTVTEGWLDQ